MCDDPEPSPRDNDADVGAGEMHHDRRCLEPGGVVREAARVTPGRLTREKIEEDILYCFSRREKTTTASRPLRGRSLYLVCSSRHLTNSTRGFDSRMDGWRAFCVLRVLLYSRRRPYRAVIEQRDR